MGDEQSMEFDGRPENLAEVGRWIRRRCDECVLDEDEANRVEVCTMEAVNNAIAHGAGKSKSLTIAVRWRATDREIRIAVSDNGREMKVLPSRTLPDTHDEDGRGWFIMSQWMDRIEYRAGLGTNTVTLCKFLA